MNWREFVTCAICAGLATTVAKVGALAQDGDPITVGGAQYPNRKAFVETGRRCGTPLPSLYDIRRTEHVRSALRTNRIDFNTKTIVPVYVHIIQDGTLGDLSGPADHRAVCPAQSGLRSDADCSSALDSVGRHHQSALVSGRPLHAGRS